MTCFSNFRSQIGGMMGHSFNPAACPSFLARGCVSVLPGSILCKALTAIDYTFHLYECFSDFRSTQTLSHYIGPIICGLLGTVILALLVSIKEIL